MLAFPTRNHVEGTRKPGYPVRAHHCMCEPAPLVCEGDDTCAKCGKHTKAIVARTWRIRAQQVAQFEVKRETA